MKFTEEVGCLSTDFSSATTNEGASALNQFVLGISHIIEKMFEAEASPWLPDHRICNGKFLEIALDSDGEFVCDIDGEHECLLDCAWELRDLCHGGVFCQWIDSKE